MNMQSPKHVNYLIAVVDIHDGFGKMAYCQQWTTIRGATCICDAIFYHSATAEQLKATKTQLFTTHATYGSVPKS